MTDRAHSLTVVLQRDMRLDDIEDTMNAIRCLRNVAEVSPIVADVVSHMATIRAKQELFEQLLLVCKP